MQDLAASLSVHTYTPIPYFLSLPLPEMVDWIERVNKRRKGKGKRD